MIFSTLYNVGMTLAAALLPVGKLLGKKARLLIEGQEKINPEELAAWRNSREKVIWFHCASLGEFEQGRPVLEAFREKNPEYGVLLTFFSPSGYEIRKNYPLADFICYLPLDTARNARKFVEAARPDIAIWVKYEFWPNIIGEIRRSGARLIGISVILRKKQAFFQPWGGFFRETLYRFDHLFVQNQASAELLDSIGYTRYQVAGDTRFDRVIATAKDTSEVPGIRRFIESNQGSSGNPPHPEFDPERFSSSLELTDGNSSGTPDPERFSSSLELTDSNSSGTPDPERFSSSLELTDSDSSGTPNPGLSTRNSPPGTLHPAPGTKVLVAGSVWPEDMDVLKPFMAAHPEMKFIIAPHNIKPEQISRWIDETSGLRYSEIDRHSCENILYIDSIGLLARLYKYAGYALVGGGFRTGLHNILEPAVFGIPVFFGDRKYKKFQEALDLLDLGVAFTIHGTLEEVFEGLDLAEIRRKADAYVNRNTGATGKILAYLES